MQRLPTDGRAIVAAVLNTVGIVLDSAAFHGGHCILRCDPTALRFHVPMANGQALSGIVQSGYSHLRASPNQNFLCYVLDAVGWGLANLGCCFGVRRV